MTQLREKIKIQELPIFDYIIVFILIIYLGSATTFTRATDTWDNMLAMLIPPVLAVLFALYKRIVITKEFYYLIIGYVIYFVISTLKFKELHPRFFGIYFISFFVGYVLFSGLQYRLFKIYEQILTLLAAVGILMWIFLQLSPEYFTSLVGEIEFSEPGSLNVKHNIIVYTISDIDFLQQYVMDFGNFKLIRNAGFAWEPGAFATFLNLAIYINLIRSGFVLRRNYNILILFLALVTTLSTSGYGIFAVLIVFYLYNKRSKYFVLALPFLITLFFLVSTLPFMTDKLVQVSEFDTEELVRNSALYGSTHTPQRFQSFLIDMVDFRNHPILGYGGHNKARWTEQMGAQIATISGIGGILARFGVVGFLFFITNLILTSKNFTKENNVRGWGFHFLIIILISISYGILFNSILLCFWLYNSNYLPSSEKLKLFISNNLL